METQASRNAANYEKVSRIQLGPLEAEMSSEFENIR
jgi:hypothetical protein